MTDKLAPGQLRDLAEIVSASGIVVSRDQQSVTRRHVYTDLADDLRDEAARREAEGQPDAPPPTAPDLVQRLRGYNPPDRTVDEQRQIAADIHEAADAIEALRAERDTALEDARSWRVYQNVAEIAQRERAEAAEAQVAALRGAMERYLIAKTALREASKQDEHEPYRSALVEYDNAETGMQTALAGVQK